MATHSSALDWKRPWMEEPGGLQSMGLLGVRHDWATSFSLFTFHFHALEKEMATRSSVPAWRIPGTGEPGWLPSLGSHRVRHDWGDLAASLWLLPTWLWRHLMAVSSGPLHLRVTYSFAGPGFRILLCLSGQASPWYQPPPTLICPLGPAVRLCLLAWFWFSFLNKI